jgi:hypothetical protein
VRKTWSTVAWPVLLIAVIAAFFNESLFRDHTLVPTDLLHNLMLPYADPRRPVEVQNHYAMDALTTDYPLGKFWQESMKRDSELPLWNPYILGGTPNLADSMPAVLSPFKVLYFALSPERAFTLGIVLQFMMAGLFMFALLREVGRSRPSSFIGACAWALNSSFLMWYWRSPSVFCWAPLVLLLLHRSLKREHWIPVLVGGVVFGLALLSGNIQAGAQLGFLCGTYGLGLVAVEPAGHRLRAFGRVSFLLLIGVLVSTVQWLPAMELMSLDAYGGTQVRGAHMSLRHTFLGIPALITFALPALTGSSESFDLLKAAGASRGDFSGYIGILPFTLFLIGAYASRDRRVRNILWIIAAVAGLVFLTPLVKYLYDRFLVVGVFGMAYASAFGADILLERPEESAAKISRIFRLTEIMCALVACGLLGFQVLMFWKGAGLMAKAQTYISHEAYKYAFGFRTDWFAERVRSFFCHYSLANVEFWLPLATVTIACFAWVLYRRQKLKQALLAGVFVSLTVIDLGILGRRLMPQCDLQKYPVHPQSSLLAPIEKERDLFRIHHLGQNAVYIFRPNWLMGYGIYDLIGNFSLAPETAERLPFETNGQFNAILDVVNVKYLVAETNYIPPSERFDLVTESDGVRLYRNSRCLPRLNLYSQWQVVPDRRKMLEVMKSTDFRPSEIVLLEESPSAAPSPTFTGASIVVERYTANRVIAQVTAPREGVLLLADTWYPGWKVSVDGKTAPLLRANHILRATVVPAGEHRVEFYYDPVIFRIGSLVSLATLAAVATLAGADTFRRNRRLPAVHS